MQIPLWVSRVSGIHPFFFWPHHVRRQNKDYSRLAGIQESQGYSILLRLCKLLLLVYLQLLRHCHSIDIPHLEGHSLEVQLLLSRCFQLYRWQVVYGPKQSTPPWQQNLCTICWQPPHMHSLVQSWSYPCQTFWSKQNTGISLLQILLA